LESEPGALRTELRVSIPEGVTPALSDRAEFGLPRMALKGALRLSLDEPRIVPF
jgi:hypothetical protein